MTTHLQAQFYGRKTGGRDKRIVARVWQSERCKINAAAQGTDKESDKCEAEIPHRSSTDMDTSPVAQNSHNSTF